MSLTTKRALAESFKKLVEKRGMDKITVKDIVEDCGVNRQTFYYHFHDIYDLMEWIFLDAAETLMRNLDYKDWTAGMETLMTYLEENRVLVLHAYHSISHEVLADYIKKIMRPYVLLVVQAQAAEMEPPAREEDVAFVTDIFNLAASGLIMEWIGKQMRTTDTADRIHKFRAAMSGSVRFMLHNLREGRG